MGGTVSVIPDKLTERDVKSLTGNKFDKNLFDSLKDENGFITKEQIIEVSKPTQKKLKDQFLLFGDKNGELDSKSFQKLCRDSNLLDNSFRPTDADLIFASAKFEDGNNKTISYEAFRNTAIPAIAQKKGVTDQWIIMLIGQSDGPVLNGTVAENVRLHDDPSTYTGARAQTRESFDRRSSRDVANDRRISFTEDSFDGKGPYEQEAKEQFMRFCPDGEMDSKTFVKLCRDCHLIDSNTFQPGDVDIVFQKGKTQQGQKQQTTVKAISYNTFRLVCVPGIANKKLLSLQEVLRAIASAEGPHLNATVADNVRLHDDTKSYTGTHARKLSMSGSDTTLSPERKSSKVDFNLDPSYDPKAPNEREAKELFLKFCPDGNMDSMAFVKLCRDTDLIDGDYRQEDADIVYQKAKTQQSNEQRQTQGIVAKDINFNTFRMVCVPSIALKKGVTVGTVVSQIASSSGPTFQATVADNVRFHDDKGTYTGTQARRSSKADGSFQTDEAKEEEVIEGFDPKAPNEREAKEQFLKFCPDGNMDSKSFVKLCRDCDLIDGSRLRPEDCDVIYQKGKAKQTKAQGIPVANISYDIFRIICAPAIASKKGVTAQEVIGQIAQSEGPTIRATVAENVRLHDDPNMYTGTRRLSSAGAGNGSPERRASRAALALDEDFDPRGPYEREAKELFLKFCPDGNMDSMAFVKLCRDTDLIDGDYRQEDADIVYQKAKTHESTITKQTQGIVAKAVSYNTFRILCIPAIANKKNSSTQYILGLLAQSNGPVLNGTVADNVRLHDDPNAYTGVHARRMSSAGVDNASPERRISKADYSINDTYDPKGHYEQEAKEQFMRFCPDGEMDSKTFVKLCRDCHLIDSNTFQPGDVDIVFQKGKTQQGQKQQTTVKAISYNTFRLVCVPGIANKKGLSPTDILIKIGLGDGPHLNATVAENVRFHDDKTTYTGTHAQGGPAADPTATLTERRPSGAPATRRASSTEHQRTSSRAGGARRGSKADMEVAAEVARKQSVNGGPRLSGEFSRNSLTRKSSQADEISSSSKYALENYPEESVETELFAASNFEKSDAVKAVFMKFCSGGDMSSSQFIKMMRDGNLLNHSYTGADAELIYVKAKQKASGGGTLAAGQKVSFKVFSSVCIPAIAEKRGETVAEFMEVLSSLDGPTLHATQAEAVRLHDDKSTYTGSHAA